MHLTPSHDGHNKGQTVATISDILMESARDLTIAHMEGKPLDSIKAEAAARIAAHYSAKCRHCGEDTGHPGITRCRVCARIWS